MPHAVSDVRAVFDESGGNVMSLSIQTQTPRTTSRNGAGVEIDKLRALIAKHLNVDIGRVTDDAHLSHDLGADWLDRLELIILVEEIAGVEIADAEADRIDVIGDLIECLDEKMTRVCR
jgi:acyl carrier protein